MPQLPPFLSARRSFQRNIWARGSTTPCDVHRTQDTGSTPDFELQATVFQSEKIQANGIRVLLPLPSAVTLRCGPVPMGCVTGAGSYSHPIHFPTNVCGSTLEFSCVVFHPATLQYPLLDGSIHTEDSASGIRLTELKYYKPQTKTSSHAKPAPSLHFCYSWS